VHDELEEIVDKPAEARRAGACLPADGEVSARTGLPARSGGHITETGYAKAPKSDLYRSQSAAARACRAPGRLKQDDNRQPFFVSSTRLDPFFTKQGRVVPRQAYDLPERRGHSPRVNTSRTCSPLPRPRKRIAQVIQIKSYEGRARTSIGHRNGLA